MTAPAKPARKRGPSNPPDSPWFNGGSRASRKRKKAEFTLPDEAHAAIERMAARGRDGNRSRAVAEAVIAADAREEAEGENRRRERT